MRLALDPQLAGVTGKYFSDAREASSSRESHDVTVQRRLYDVSCELAGVTPLPDA